MCVFSCKKTHWLITILSLQGYMSAAGRQDGHHNGNWLALIRAAWVWDEELSSTTLRQVERDCDNLRRMRNSEGWTAGGWWSSLSHNDLRERRIAQEELTWRWWTWPGINDLGERKRGWKRPRALWEWRVFLGIMTFCGDGGVNIWRGDKGNGQVTWNICTLLG